MSWFLLGYIFFGLVILGVVGYLAWDLKKKYFLQTLKLRLLVVRLPKKSDTPQQSAPESLKEINSTSQFLGALGSLQIPFVFEVAVHVVGEEINFYLAVPENAIEFAARQIQGFWNDAVVEPVEDYNMFNREGVSEGVIIKQQATYVLPVRTYEEINLDTFMPILSAFSKIQAAGEGVALQLVLKPAPVSIKKSFQSIIYQLKKGARVDEVIRSKFITLKDVQRALEGKKKDDQQGVKPVLD